MKYLNGKILFFSMVIYFAGCDVVTLKEKPHTGYLYEKPEHILEETRTHLTNPEEIIGKDEEKVGIEEQEEETIAKEEEEEIVKEDEKEDLEHNHRHHHHHHNHRHHLHQHIQPPDEHIAAEHQDLKGNHGDENLEKEQHFDKIQ